MLFQVVDAEVQLVVAEAADDGIGVRGVEQRLQHERAVLEINGRGKIDAEVAGRRAIQLGNLHPQHNLVHAGNLEHVDDAIRSFVLTAVTSSAGSSPLETRSAVPTAVTASAVRPITESASAVSIWGSVISYSGVASIISTTVSVSGVCSDVGTESRSGRCRTLVTVIVVPVIIAPRLAGPGEPSAEDVDLFAADEVEDLRRFGDVAGLTENYNPLAKGPQSHLAVGEELGNLRFQLSQMRVMGFEIGHNVY